MQIVNPRFARIKIVNPRFARINYEKTADGMKFLPAASGIAVFITVTF